MCLALIPTAVLTAFNGDSQGVGIGVIVLCACYVVGFAYR